MDRAMLEQNLRQAEGHAALGEEHIERQRQIVSDLERDGHDTTMARTLLKTFEDTQAMHLADVARLTRELSELPK